MILACLPVVLRLRDGHRMIMLCDETRSAGGRRSQASRHLPAASVQDARAKFDKAGVKAGGDEPEDLDELVERWTPPASPWRSTPASPWPTPGSATTT